MDYCRHSYMKKDYLAIQNDHFRGKKIRKRQKDAKTAKRTKRKHQICESVRITNHPQPKSAHPKRIPPNYPARRYNQ